MRNLHKLSLLLIAVISCILIISCGGATAKKGEGNFKKLANGGEINGPRSIENIEENIKMLVPRFEYFYKKRLKINPDLKGTMEFIIDIDANGDVFYSSIGNSTTNDPDFDDEILHAITLHKFGQWTEGRGKTEVIYPFSFSQEGIKPARERAAKGIAKPPETKPTEEEIKAPEEASDEDVDADEEVDFEEEGETEEESEGFLDDE